MTKVNRTWRGPPATSATLSLARNEREALQLVVLAGGDAGQDGGVCGLSWSATPFARQGQEPRGSGEPAPQLGVRVQPIGYVHTGPCPYNATNSSFCTNASLPIYCKLGLLTDPEMRPTCVSGEHNRLRCTRPLSLACGPHTDGACCR